MTYYLYLLVAIFSTGFNFDLAAAKGSSLALFIESSLALFPVCGLPAGVATVFL